METQFVTVRMCDHVCGMTHLCVGHGSFVCVEEAGLCKSSLRRFVCVFMCVT